MHHWSDWRRGMAEALRVANGRLVLLTWLNEDLPFWLYDYFPGMRDINQALFQPIEALESVIGKVTVSPVTIAHDCSDGFLCAYWRRPEAYLNPNVRRSISIFAMIDGVAEGLARLQRDLESGEWHARHAALREREAMDFGYRLLSVPT